MPDQIRPECREKFKKSEEADVKVLKTLDRIERRLFYDNGAESIQSKLNRHDRTLKWIIGIVATVGTAAISASIWSFFV